ncbi:Hemolymph lipopolysaccharide-binding protein [Gryllus bimaculatus]|nr:Hemolymph lipopolysaccharide-binding protein [Gryllus bimaculatus]
MSSSYRWGTPLSSIGYQKWAPDQQHTQICGSINHAALLYDAKCTDKRSFICEFKKDAAAAFKLTDAPILLPDSTPQQKYTPIKLTPDRRYVGLVQQGRLHYYRVSEPSEKMRWARANSVCQDEGGHLLVINHQFEADTLKDHLKKLNIASDVYVGLRNGPNKFVTVFGKTLVNAGYVNWESEQPEDETCLAVDQNMLLKKIPCWEERQFICEMTLL